MIIIVNPKSRNLGKISDITNNTKRKLSIITTIFLVGGSVIHKYRSFIFVFFHQLIEWLPLYARPSLTVSALITSISFTLTFMVFDASFPLDNAMIVNFVLPFERFNLNRLIPDASTSMVFVLNPLSIISLTLSAGLQLH